jgi:hypothetical protein
LVREHDAKKREHIVGLDRRKSSHRAVSLDAHTRGCAIQSPAAVNAAGLTFGPQPRRSLVRRTGLDKK